MRWLGCGEQQVRVFDHRVPGGPQPEQVGVDLGLRLAGVVRCKPAPLHAQEQPSCRPGTERPCHSHNQSYRWSGELCGRCAIHPLLVILLSNTCGNGTFSKKITLATSDKGSIVAYFFSQQIFNLPKCAHHCKILYCRIKYEIELATSYFKCG